MTNTQNNCLCPIERSQLTSLSENPIPNPGRGWAGKKSPGGFSSVVTPPERKKNPWIQSRTLKHLTSLPQVRKTTTSDLTTCAHTHTDQAGKKKEKEGRRKEEKSASNWRKRRMKCRPTLIWFPTRSSLGRSHSSNKEIYLVYATIRFYEGIVQSHWHMNEIDDMYLLPQNNFN